MMRRLLFALFRRIHRLNRRLRQWLSDAGLFVAGAMLLAGVFGVDTRQNNAHQLFALLFGLLLTGWLARRRPPRVTLARELPRYATIHEPIRYRLRVANPGSRTLRGLILWEELAETYPDPASFRASAWTGGRRINPLDAWIGYPRWAWLVALSRGAKVDPVTLPFLPEGAFGEVEMSLTPLRRGYIEFSRVMAGLPDPLGLVLGLRRLECPDRLLVLPRRHPVPVLPFQAGRRYQPGGVGLALTVGNQDEFIGLRDYRPGDPLKRIDWKGLARLGRPVVKEYQDEYFVRYGLILDTFGAAAGAPPFEAAVSVAASLVTAEWGQEALLDLLLVGSRVHRFTAGRGLGQAEQLLTVLACATASPDSPRAFADLEALLVSQSKALCGCVCVLLAWDPPRQALVQSLRSRGVQVLALVVAESIPPNSPPVTVISPQDPGPALARLHL
ncbi:Conserved repeat protein [Gammaproteobacteria bacterium]